MIGKTSPSTIRTAMVLAAGYGTRMKELTRNLPKPLLPLTEAYCLIDVVILRLARAGIRRVVVNLHYHGDRLREHLGDGSRYGVELFFSQEPELLGSGGGIAAAEPFFEGEPIVAVNADVLCTIDVQELYAFHRHQGALATMAVLPSRDTENYSLVIYQPEGWVRGFLRKNSPLPPDVHTGIFTGHQILTPEARRYLRPQPQSIIEHLYRPALQQGQPIAAFPFTGTWVDLGTREQYVRFRERLQSGTVDLGEFM